MKYTADKYKGEAGAISFLPCPGCGQMIPPGAMCAPCLREWMAGVLSGRQARKAGYHVNRYNGKRQPMPSCASCRHWTCAGSEGGFCAGWRPEVKHKLTPAGESCERWAPEQ